MKEEQIHIPVKGSMAFARLWHAKGEAKGLVLIVHGVAEHSLRYADFALFLSHHGYHAVAYDLRGHGYSAVSSSSGSDKIALKKNLYTHPEFGYISEEEGWYSWVEDLRQIMEYVSDRYKIPRLYLFGHSMGSMIIRSALSILPHNQLDKIKGIILSAPPGNSGLVGNFFANKLKAHIRRHGDDYVSRKIEKLFNSHYSSKRFGPPRTELDWISSQPDEVDAYIADALCGNTLRLGLYLALTEINIYIYSRMFRRNLRREPIPIYIFAGADDPVSGFGKDVEKLSEFFIKHGWLDVKTELYPGIRHESLHDISKATAMDRVLAWLNEH